MEKKKKSELDIDNINEVVSLSSKILHILYVMMIIGIVFIATILIKEWGILTFILNLLKVLSPLFIGFVIAWLFNPFVKKLEKKGIKRTFGAIIVYVIFLLFLIVFLRFLVPTIYVQINELIKNLPAIFNSGKDFINSAFDNMNNVEGLDIMEIKNNFISGFEDKLVSFTTTFPAKALDILAGTFSSVATIAMGLFVGLYMLFDFDSISHHFLDLLPEKWRFEASVLLTNIGDEVRKCVNGTLLVATIVFIGDSLCFWIFGLQAPLLFGLFCGLTDLIPYIGPYIGGAVAVIIGFSQSTFIGIMVLIACIVVQSIENFILQPVVMSKTMKLHPVTIIIGLLIFSNFFGIMGMILATPCIALLKVIWQFIQNKYKIFQN